MSAISPRQLVALQSLYSQYARRLLDVAGDGREERIRWASEQVGRNVSSFRQLRREEANRLIDALQVALGGQPGGMRNRDRARAAGTEGRRGSGRDMSTLVGQQDLDRINDALHRLGWDQARFEAWLRSPSSPLGRRRSDPQIRTVGDANRVWWALKRLLKRSGQWSTRRPE